MDVYLGSGKEEVRRSFLFAFPWKTPRPKSEKEMRENDGE
jgi:hypothetical protein